MFKIESYITPILMNHVAKYVKNIRPQDAQLSLWEGEALFQNLELRLDVLEEELNLPFNLVSGNIHELIIRVPWTKITSEPIKVTINTIELVLQKKGTKLLNDDSPTASVQHQPEVSTKRRSIAGQEDQPQQQTAYSALINKIINNVVVNCHNIILKYLEDDIMISLNVQLLSFGSADENWKTAMIDLNPVKVLMRKMVTISDLTICLDKMNAAGKIEVCHEPVLYRCTLECRILRKYNVNTAASTSMTRIGISTKSLELNLSTMQFPLLTRLILLLAKRKSEETTTDATATSLPSGETSAPQALCHESNESYLSWAWSLLPSFELFEDEEPETDAFVDSPGHTMDVGFYIEQLNFTFKKAEFINEFIIGATKRIRYTPIMRLFFGGLYFERISSEELNWSNYKAGISSICVEPLGSYRSDDKCRDPVMESPAVDASRSFVDRSLFDDTCVISDKGWAVTNYEDYVVRITDEYLLYRSPIFAFDMVRCQHLDKPEKQVESNVIRNNGLFVQYRFLSSNVTCRYTESLLQVINLIKELIETSDYSAYYAEGDVDLDKREKPHHDDFEALKINIPFQNYKIEIFNIIVEIYPKLELTDPKTQKRIANNQKHVVPHLVISVEEASGIVITPIDPNMVVNITSMLPIEDALKNPLLIDACYTKYKFHVKNVHCSLSNKSSAFNKFVSIPITRINYLALIQPMLFEENEYPEHKLEIDCEEIHVEFSKREMVLIERLINCIKTYDEHLLWKIIKHAWRPTSYEDTIKMQTKCVRFHKSLRLYRTYDAFNICIKSLLSEIICNKNTCELKKVEILTTNQWSKDNKWLEFQAQFPKDHSNDEFGVNAIALWIDKFNIYFEPQLLDFLNYYEEYEKVLEKDKIFTADNIVQPQAPSPVVVTTNLITTQLPPNQSKRSLTRNMLQYERNIRKISAPAETIHISSDRDEKIELEDESSLQFHNKERSYKFWLHFLRNIALNIDIAQGAIHVASSSKGNQIKSQERSCMEIKLPSISLKSAYSDQIIRSNLQNKITIPVFNLQKETFTFSLILDDFAFRCGTQSNMQYILMPINLSLLLSVTHKKEKFKEKDIAIDSSEGISPEITKIQTATQQPKKTTTRARAKSPTHAENKKSSKSNGSSSNDGRDSDLGGKSSIAEAVPKKQKSNISLKKKLMDFITINLHFNTPPITILLSNKKFKVIKEPLSLMENIWLSFQIIAVDIEDDIPSEPLQIITATEENASIKDFFELETSSASSKVSESKPQKNFRFLFFLQLTIAKILLELEVEGVKNNKKCILELEDLLFAVDEKNEIKKCTCTLGDLKLLYFEFLNNVWRVNDSIRIQKLDENSGRKYFNFVYNVVVIRDYFKQMGIKQRRGDLNRTMGEIDINLEFTEIILDFEKLTEFLLPWHMVSNDWTDYSQRRRKLKSEKSNGHEQFYTVAMLPMLCIKSKGFILYLPVENKKAACSAIIMKVEAIEILNNPTNPIPRKPIRTDVWNKAAKLNMLSEPGAFIEDRQYEIILSNISAATGNWFHIRTYMKETEYSSNRPNPAFDWNNPERKTPLQFTDFFINLKLVTKYAPCVEYNNVLICGQDLDVSCDSDLVAELTTAQISCLSCLIGNYYNISNAIDKLFNNDAITPLKSVSDSIIRTLNKSNSSMRTSKSCDSVKSRPWEKKRYAIYKDAISSSTIYRSITEEQQNSVNTDSGFMSCAQSSYQSFLGRGKNNSHERFTSLTSQSSILQERTDYTDSPKRHIPYTISIAAGIFILKLFETKLTNDNQKESGKIPLLSFTFTQTNFLLLQSIFELTTKVELFNINLNMCCKDVIKYTLPPPTSTDTDNPEVAEEQENLFPYALVVTKLGTTDSSGLLPPIFRLKINISKSQLKEVDVEFCKPIVINFAEDHIERLCNCLLHIYKASAENICQKDSLPSANRKIVRESKIKLMRRQCFNADHIILSMDKIEVKVFNPEAYNAKIILSNAKATVKFLTRPEKASANIVIGAFYLRTDHKIFIHPINLRLSVDFVSEPWYRLPLVKSTAKFNVVQIDLGVYSLRSLRNFFEGYKRVKIYLDEVMEEMQRIPSHDDQVGYEIKSESWLPIKCPTLNTENLADKHKREEYYQDDLRAGAFQFVEMTVDTFLPLPYQIQIIKKNFGTICWRYPQPRKMVKISLFPVPMAAPNPTNIKCRMEYFSETHEQFMEYLDFCLSETVSKDLELPEREICAYIWRVVIMQAVVSVNANCFDDIEEEDSRSITTIDKQDIVKAIKGSSERTDDSEYILHPKVLVGCMRIDTAFQSDSVPRIQVLFSVNKIMLSFLNQPDEHVQLPSFLRKFKMAQTTQISQTFMTCFVERVSLFLIFNSLQKFSLNSDLTFHIKCIDYAFLNMVYLLEECRLQNYFNLNEKANSLVSNLSVDKINLNIGPSILHTLLSSKKHWVEFLDQGGQEKYAFIPKCIVVNRTHGVFTFGQSGTAERILLKPRECIMYSFRSDYFKQELTFFLTDDLTKITQASQPVKIVFKFPEDTRIENIRVGNKCLIVKSRRLSASQIYILVKGQFEITSMVNYEFNLEISGDNLIYGEKMGREYAIKKKDRVTFFRSVQHDSVIAMRMKLQDVKGKYRSGDIPLRSNKHLPWLVKVPKKSDEFISFWVRIVREDIKELWVDDFKPQRLLIMIWPIFEVASLLTTPITAEETNTQQQISLPVGGRELLNVPATHLSEHTISFFYNFKLAEDSRSKFCLSLKNLNWHKFFLYDEKKWIIETTLNELAKSSRTKWLVVDENECRIKRTSILVNPVTVVYKCVPTREFGCSLTLEVAPWGLFINSTGELVSVYNLGTYDKIHIEANGMEMMFSLNGVFQLKVQNNTNWYESLPIYFDSSVAKKPGKHYFLRENINTEIVILCGLQVDIFLLEMRIEGRRRIFMLRSKFCVVNFTKNKLCLMPFAIGQKEKTNRQEIQTLDSQMRKKYVPPVTSMGNCVGVALDVYNDIHFRKSIRSTDTVFHFYVCIKVCEESEISMPILLSSQYTRRCLSISNYSDSIPLVTSLIEKNGVHYLNIFEDIRPAFLLNNQTEIKLFVAQTNAAEHSVISKVAPEYGGLHFNWYQLLPAHSKVYYTPPDMSEHFPEVESNICNLTIAIFTDDIEKKGIKWSKPIRTDKTWEKYLNVPNYGDVRVVVCDQHKVIRVTIYYIAQQLEFSVKDLRLRLSANPSYQSLHNRLSGVDDDDEDLLPHSRADNSKVEIKPRTRCIHFRSDCTQKLQIKVRCIIKELNFCLKTDDKDLDYKKIEIMALAVDDLFVVFDENDNQRQMNIIVSNMQIDNQLYTTGKFDFPVVLCSQELYVRNPIVPHIYHLDKVYNELLNRRKPMSVFTINLYDDEFVVRSFVCNISPIRAYIEDSYLNELLEALLECDPSNCAFLATADTERLELKNDQILVPKDVAAQAIYIADPMKLQSFRIQPLNVLLSVHTSVRLYIALDHSPLSFSAYEKTQIFTVPLRFGQSLGMHYLSGAIFGAGWVVGSLEILGSPSCLARSFSTGLRDFVSMPVQGLFLGPWGFFVGITQGSASLLRNVTAGTVNSVTKLAASVARNLDRMTLDADHIERTEALRRSRPQGFTEGFSQGITGLGISILGAVGGLARHPLEARSPVEVVTGVGKGLVGAVTKPISGAVELVALAGQGMLHTVGFNTMPMQRTPATDNIYIEPSSYRIWRLLPDVLLSDQILFYHEVMLVVKDQLRKGYAFLTSAVFSIMESQWDKLSFTFAAEKIVLYVDKNDKTLIHLKKVIDDEEIDENQVYQTQRIMHFLAASTTSIHMRDHITNDSFNDILHAAERPDKDYEIWSFHINEHMGQHLVHYLKIVNDRTKKATR